MNIVVGISKILLYLRCKTLLIMSAKKYYEKQERLMLEQQVNYNNDWNGSGIWRCFIQNKLDEAMSKNDVSQLLDPIKLDSNAVDVLFSEPYIAKLFSIFLDVYDELPYRPDAGFDMVWRAFEMLLQYYYDVEGIKSIEQYDTVDKRLNLVAGTLSVLSDRDPNVHQLLEKLLQEQPVSSLRFCVSLLKDKAKVPEYYDLLFNESNKFKSRFKEATGEIVYNNYISQFLNDDYYNYLTQHNNKKANEIVEEAANCLKVIMTTNGGNTFVVGTSDYSSLALNKRIALFVKGVLYTVRNNRFHGNNYSLFKSSRSKLASYHSQYFCLISTYTLFWIVLYDLLEKKGVSTFFSIDSIVTFLDEALRRLRFIDETQGSSEE